MLMCIESELRCGLLQCSCYLAWQIGSVLNVCRNCGMQQCWICMFKLCCEFLLLLNMADMDCLSCGRLWSEHLVTLFIQCVSLVPGALETKLTMHMNRLSAARVLWWVHSWQNGTKCRDGVKVVSFPSSLVGFLGFHPYMCLFSFRKLVPAVFFFIFTFIFGFSSLTAVPSEN